MKRRQLVLGISLSLATALLFFENCSKANFASSGADLESLALSTPLQVGESQIKISAQQVPNLKLFFVVDNSYTMKANQVNLGRSFAEMFSDDKNNSLKSFDTTAFLISTAQKSEPLGSAALKTVATPQLSAAQVAGLSLADLARLRAGSIATGVLPGDSIGIFASVLNGGLAASFLPAPVLGDDGTGAVGIGIHKAAGVPSDALAAEFQNRLALLNSDRQPIDDDKTQIFGDVLDNESGLCAAARILQNPKGFVGQGEQAAFVIVSDEDDNDVAGQSCVQAFRTIQSTDDLIKGSCDNRFSTLTFAKKAPDTCKANFQTGYNVAYTYQVPQTKTKVTYRKVTAATYNVPQSTISWKITKSTYTPISTPVKYYTKSTEPVMLDNAPTGQFRDKFTGPINGTLKGNVAADACTAAARAAYPDATDDKNHLPSCGPSVAGTPAASCPANQTCTFASGPADGGSQVVDGLYTGDACLTRAKALDSKAISASCPATTAGRDVSSCSSALLALGCGQKTPASTSTPSVDVDGDQSADDNCFKAAGKLSGASIDRNDRTTWSCASPVTKDVPRPFNTNILFANSGDGGTLVPQSSPDCGSIRKAVVTAAKVDNANAPDDKSTFTCKITGYSGSSADASVANGACDAASVAQVCSSSNGEKRTCTAKFNPGAAGATPTVMPEVPYAIACDDLCQDSNNVLCAAAPGVTVSDKMTIRQYLIARYGDGTTCNIPAPRAQPVFSFNDKLVSEKGNLCNAQASPRQYLNASASYRSPNKVATDWVVSNSADGSKPASGLDEFLVSASSGYFNFVQPLVSVLVRIKDKDPEGKGGSWGVNYARVATTMGGRADSVLSGDYSDSLHALSGIIQSRLQRSFVIADMKPAQSVHQVMMLKAGTSQWILLQPSEWTAVGNNVVIAPTVAYSPDDYLRVRYY